MPKCEVFSQNLKLKFEALNTKLAVKLRRLCLTLEDDVESHGVTIWSFKLNLWSSNFEVDIWSEVDFLSWGLKLKPDFEVGSGSLRF